MHEQIARQAAAASDAVTTSSATQVTFGTAESCQGFRRSLIAVDSSGQYDVPER